jgi:HAMP domain-containing protein
LFGVGFFLVLLILLSFSTVVSDLWKQNKHMAKEIGLLEETVRELKDQLNQSIE